MRSPDEAGPPRGTSIDDLLDRAVSAINRGDRATATALAGQVLAVDEGNAEAEDLLAAPNDAGEIRRLTISFADLVDSTALSTRVEPEIYRLLVGRYREIVQRIVQRYEGHIGSTQGDGLLAMFGHPVAHEDDARRAVQAGLDITREVARLSEQAKRRFGIELSVRVGVHRGLVYLDIAHDDVYGLAANLAARVSALAPPGSVVVSDAVEPLVRNGFELDALPAAPVKGVGELIVHHRVMGERAVPTRTVHGPLVGREAELASLKKHWAHAQAGARTGSGVVIRGEPGIGKSRLAAAAMELAERDGAVVLELSGSPFHADVGLHPVRTLIERRCGIDRDMGPRERLRRLEAALRTLAMSPAETVPLLAPVLGIAPEHGYDAVAADGPKLQELIAETVKSYTLASIGAGPGLLVAEDAHWFDASTLELLGKLLNSQSHLLLMITGRRGGWLPDDWRVTMLELVPLTDEQTDALILTLDPTVNLDQCAAVRARCDGVPFYVEQVVAGLRAASADAAEVPEALYEPLFARLRASPNAVQVVEAAALIGREVDCGLLLAVLDLGEEELDGVIGQLADALVFESRTGHRWRFRHELLREVAAELAPPSVRRDLHAKVADALVEHTADRDPDWRMVADHYERAERFADTALAYQHAAADARRRGALAEARNYLTRAIGHVETVNPGQERNRQELMLRLERGLLTTAAEGFSSRAAVADIERCLQVGGTDLRDDRVFATLTSVASYYITRADLSRAQQVTELLRQGTEQGRDWFRPALECMPGLLAFLRGEFDAARPYFDAMVAGVAANHDRIDAVWVNPNDLLVMARAVLGLIRMVQGDLIGAEAELTEAADYAERLPSPKGPYSTAHVRFIQVWIYTEVGQLDRAEAFVSDLLDLSERHGFDAWRGLGTMQQGFIDALRLIGPPTASSELPARLSALAESVDMFRSLELKIYLTAFDGILGRLLIAAGHFEAARRRLDIGLRLAEETQMHFYDAELLRLRARTLLDPDARAACMGDALSLAHCQGAHLFELRAALDDFDHRGDPARAALDDVVSRMPVNSGWPELARAKAALADAQ